MNHLLTLLRRCWLLAGLLLGPLAEARAQTFVMDNTPVTTCAGTFYNSGGQYGGYAAQEDFTKTFSPSTAGQAVRLSFAYLVLGYNLDYLELYDGPTTSAKLLGRYTGVESPFTVAATNATGQLTVHFTSRASGTSKGWQATLGCVVALEAPVVTCADTFTDLGGATGDYAAQEDYTRTFSPATPGQASRLAFSKFSLTPGYDFLELYDGPSTSARLIGRYTGTGSPGTVTATTAGGQLTAHFYSAAASSGWEAAVSCAPPATPPPNLYLMNNEPVTTCAGTFTDSGGPGNGVYSPGESYTKTFSPATPGQAISLTFSVFDLSPGNDFLELYDGPSTSARLIGRYSGRDSDFDLGTGSPGTVTATNATGQLTARFTSSYSAPKAGWEAAVSCAPPGPAPTPPQYLMNNEPVTTCAGTFTDSGGPGNGVYSPGESFVKTFSPATPGAVMQLAFSAFNVLAADLLELYDGPGTSARLIGRYTGASSPGTVTAANATGQLTARFTSSNLSSGAGLGWVANVACVEPSVNSFAPASGEPGTSVTLLVAAAGDLAATTRVTFNGQPAFFAVNSATQLTAVVPLGATSGLIQVTTPAKTVASALPFTVCGTHAVAQNISVTPDFNGGISVLPAAVDAGSTGTCGPLTLAFESPTELLQNGAFDQGAAGWVATNVGAAGGYRATDGNPGGLFVLKGNGAASTDPTLTQTLGQYTILPYRTYLLQGDYRNFDGNSNQDLTSPALAIYLNGQLLLTRTNPGPSGWMHFSCVFTLSVRRLAAYPVLALKAEIGGTAIDMAVDNLSLRNLSSSTGFSCASLGPQPLTLVAYVETGSVSTASATATVIPSSATATTWLGNSPNPQDCANWSYGKLPDASTDAYIPAHDPNALAYYPELSAGTMAVRTLTIEGNLTLGSEALLQVSGDFVHNGAATFTGEVAFVGSAATQTLGGTGATSFQTLTINKPAGLVQLQRDVAVTDDLALTSGVLSTASFRLDLGTAAALRETDASYVLGTVAATRTLLPGASQDYGGLGLTLRPATGSVAPGFTPVVRTTGTVLTGVGTSQSIARYFDIQPATNVGLNVDLTFRYFAHELNGIAPANLSVFKSATTAGPWQPLGCSSSATEAVSRSGISDFSIWTLGDATKPLPVTLVAFTAQRQGADSFLHWTTASEVANAYFQVESSVDGAVFRVVGRVAGAGTSSQAHSYQFTDVNLARYAVGQVYYRLRQVDVSGASTYSPVRAVPVPLGAGLLVQAYPNPSPATTTVTLAMRAEHAGPVTIRLADVLGRAISQQQTELPVGLSTLSLQETSQLATGIYLLQVRQGGQQQTFKLVRQ